MRLGFSLAVVCCVAATSVASFQATASEEAAVKELERRVAGYVELHRRIEGPVPTPRVSSDAGEIRRAVDALGAQIRKARQTAKPGDIFAPEIASMIRARIRTGCGGDFESVRDTAHHDMGQIPAATVNGKWPGPAMTVMPVTVLCQLPSLPEELEYRFVNRALVLWDAHADVIVDVMPDALPPAR